MKHQILFLTVFLLLIGSCKKDDPVPKDIFVGSFFLVNVIEEYNPSNSTENKFLAPEVYDVTKTELLDPTTGTRVVAYKFEYGNRFMGLTQSDTNVIVGTDECPNTFDLKGVSITFSSINSLYTLNMLNCEGREVIAEYSPL